jgi:glycosyltransferase involved in cell wall biosynthesis
MTATDAAHRAATAEIAFLSYDPQVPSFRYRIAPVVAELTRLGRDCRVLELPSGRYGRRLFELKPVLSRARLVVLAKIKLSPPEPWWLRRVCRRLAFDFDDAIYVRRPRAPGLPPGESRWRRRKFAATCAAMDLVIAGNQTLAAAAAPHSRRIAVVPTPIDIDRYQATDFAAPRPPTLVWLGLPDNLGYLELVRPAIVTLTRRWPELRLRVICSEFPDWPEVAIDRVPWSAANEIAGLATADIGLMPLVDDEWTRGKCAFKLLQYAAASLPCVASDVGANREAVLEGSSGFLVRPGESWEAALAALLESTQLRASFGRRGREHVLQNFAAGVVSRRCSALLDELAS